MKIRPFITAAILVVTLLATPPVSRTESETIRLSVPLQNGLQAQFDVSVEKAGGDFALQKLDDSTTYTYTNEYYRIQIQDKSQTSSAIGFRMETHSGEPFGLRTLSLTTEVARNMMDGVWAPSHLGTTSIMAAEPDEHFFTVSDANYGIPYIAAATASGRNVFALGLLRQDLSVRLNSRPGTEGNQVLQIIQTTPLWDSTVEEAFFLTENPALNWFDVARQYADWVDAGTAYQPFPVSEGCFRPLYDTWYWSRDAVNDQLYADVSRVAADIGMGSFLADSGWDARTGDYDLALAGSTGDYQPPIDKFPDIGATFNFMRSIHKLALHLWLQPFAVGRESVRYVGTHDLHIATAMENDETGWAGNIDWPFSMPGSDGLMENMNLCPRRAATGTYLRELFSEMEAKYHPDGYWLDAMDLMPTMCAASHRHDYRLFGEGFRAALDAIGSTVLAHNPAAVVQMRYPYANLHTKPYANVWQTPDSPGNPDQMHLLALKLRPFSNGVVFASDQLYWPSSASEAESAKAAMTSVLVGVPSIGVDLITAPASTIRLLQTWMEFYKTYRSDLTTGSFRVFGSFRTPNHAIDSESRTFAFIRYPNSDVLLAQDKEQIFAFNATADRHLTMQIQGDANREYIVTELDRWLAPHNQTAILTDESGLLYIDSAVDEGAGVLITRQ
jgi:hypothetical protein